MGLKQWWRKRQYVAGRWMLHRQGQWGVTVDTLEYLTEQILPTDLVHFTVAELRATPVRMATTTVDELLHRLQRATEVIHAGQSFPTADQLARPRIATNLEAYLTTTDGRALTVVQTWPLVLQVTQAFIQNLRMAVSEADTLEQHYSRRCMPLLIDLHTLLLALWSNCHIASISDDVYP